MCGIVAYVDREGRERTREVLLAGLLSVALIAGHWLVLSVLMADQPGLFAQLALLARAPHGAQELQSVHGPHAVVADDGVEDLLLEHDQGLAAVRGGRPVVAAGAQGLADHVARACRRRDADCRIRSRD